MGKLYIVVMGLFVFAIGFVSNIEAQDESSWGVDFSSSVSKWEVTTTMQDLFHIPGEIDFKGREFRIGLVHGQEFGGNWGVYYVRRSISDSTYSNLNNACVYYNDGSVYCLPFGFESTFEHITMNGIEIQKYVSFATIKNRVQLGMNFGGGYARINGAAMRRNLEAIYNPEDRSLVQIEEIETVSAGMALGSFFKSGYIPLARLEGVVSIKIVHNLKLNFSGGISAPGVNRFNMGLTFFPK